MYEEASYKILKSRISNTLGKGQDFKNSIYLLLHTVEMNISSLERQK